MGDPPTKKTENSTQLELLRLNCVEVIVDEEEIGKSKNRFLEIYIFMYGQLPLQKGRERGATTNSTCRKIENRLCMDRA